MININLSTLIISKISKSMVNTRTNITSVLYFHTTTCKDYYPISLVQTF